MLFPIPGTSLQLIPVEMSTFHTVNFAQNPNHVLASGAITADVVMRIKHKDVTTMVNFFPNNLFDEQQTETNLKAAFEDFKKNGGVIDKDTIIDIMGGAPYMFDNPDYASPRAILRDVLKVIEIDGQMISKTCRILDDPRIENKTKDQKLFIFVTKDSKQILRYERLCIHADDKVTAEIHNMTIPDMVLKLGTMVELSTVNNLASAYANAWSKQIASISHIVDGMPIVSVQDAFSQYGNVSNNNNNEQKNRNVA